MCTFLPFPSFSALVRKRRLVGHRKKFDGNCKVVKPLKRSRRKVDLGEIASLDMKPFLGKVS